MEKVIVNQIISDLKNNRNIFISGSAGTGKSYQLTELVKKIGNKILLTSTTGISALNIGGQTIHSALGVGTKTSLEDYEFQIKNYWCKKKILEIKKSGIKYLIIDEISMMSGEFLDLINLLFQNFFNNKKFFGGLNLIIVGDFYQLPPIDKNNPYYSDWAFNSNTWKEANFKNYILTKSWRQNDQEFFDILNLIRRGEITDEIENKIKRNINRINDFNLDEFTRLYSRVNLVNEQNQKKLELVSNKKIVFQAKVSGSNERLIEGIKKSVVADEFLSIKVGARVMYIINNYSLNLYNGMVGVIKKINSELETIIIKFDNGQEKEISKNIWTIVDNKNKVIAKFVQFPLKLAYAITIHKSQGMSIDKLYVEARGIFEKGQLYVALSRATSLENLIISNFDKKYVYKNKIVNDFYDALD